MLIRKRKGNTRMTVTGESYKGKWIAQVNSAVLCTAPRWEILNCPQKRVTLGSEWT
jgi:hypothetical protein